MRKLLFEMAYDGSRYHGYQVQQNALSVAQVVQDAIETVFKKREDIVGCSRTDAGVHANQYFFHMETNLTIPTDAAVIALNNCLPGDVASLSCKEVEADFHARYDVCWKEYLYKIWNSKVKNPFLQNRANQVKYPIDAALLDRCAKEFVGTHDFRGFCSAGGSGRARQLCKARACRWYRAFQGFAEPQAQPAVRIAPASCLRQGLGVACASGTRRSAAL